MTHTIEIDALSKSYRGKKFARVDALKGLDLHIASGEVFGFLGPNGAGKSTTIKILMGLIRPTKGCARLSGYDCQDHRARLNVGYLPENPAFFDYLSAYEYLCFVGKMFKMNPDTLHVEKKKALDRLGLWKERNRPMRGFSKGMVQRLGLAQVLLHNPDIYILDEPMSGLDPVGRALVKDVILELKDQRKTVFFSTHITADVEVLCDSIGIVVKGELREACRVSDLLHGNKQDYLVRYRVDGCQDNKIVTIEHNQLFAWLDQHRSRCLDILSVDSQHNSLEEFFLNTVNKVSE